MPVSPEMAEDLAARVRELYDAAEVDLLERLAKALVEGIDSPAWAQLKLAAVGDLRRAVEDVTRALEQDANGAVRLALAEAYQRGEQAALVELGAVPVGNEAFIRRQLPGAAAVDRLAASYARDTRPLYARITRAVVDVFRSVVTRASGGVLLGTETRRQASQRVLNQLTRNGLSGFTDRSGRNWNLASYAEMAVRSVTARAAIEGHIDVLDRLGVGLVMVSDAPLECPLCARWEGEVLALSGEPGPRTVRTEHAVEDGRTVAVHVVGTLAEARAEGLFHPNCFPGDVVVAAPSGVRAADSRWYEGDLVVIHTASGDELPVTPNHPVLTPEGWVPAGALKVGGRVLRYGGDVERVDGVSPSDEQVPARIGDVFDALRQASPVPSVHVPGAAEQFHGDGFHAEVEVVLADGLLADGGYPERFEVPGDGTLLAGGVGLGPLLAERSPLQVSRRTGHSAHGRVCARHLGSALLGGHGRPLAGLGLATADVGSALDDPAADAALADAEGGRQLALALAGSVAVDEVVDLGRREFAGHVFNLQTGDGWYVAGGLVVHNCRHSLSAYFPGVTVRPEAPPTPGTSYEDTQRQRQIERHIRAWKRRQAASLSDDERRAAGRKVREWQAAMREHLAEHDALRRKREREQLPKTTTPAPPTPEETAAVRVRTDPGALRAMNEDDLAAAMRSPALDAADFRQIEAEVERREEQRRRDELFPGGRLVGSLDTRSEDDLGWALRFATFEEAERIAAEIDRRYPPATLPPARGASTVEGQLADRAAVDELLAPADPEDWAHLALDPEAERGDLSREERWLADRQDAADAARSTYTRAQVREMYREHVYAQYLDAEDALRGVLLSRRAAAEGIDPIALFTGPSHVAYARASEELKRWWVDHPRTTLAEYTEQVTGQRSEAGNRARASRNDQQNRL